MNEKLIQRALLKKYSSHKYKFCNIYFFNNESDFLTFLPNGNCYEFEIKISKSDFKIDKNKPRHTKYDNTNSKYYTEKGNTVTLHTPSWEFTKHFPELVVSKVYDSYRKNIQDRVELYYTPYSTVYFRSIKHDSMPNRFYYVVPKDLISKDDVPEYAGLLYVTEENTVIKVKEAQVLHKQKLDTHRAFNKAYYTYERVLINKLNN